MSAWIGRKMVVEEKQKSCCEHNLHLLNKPGEGTQQGATWGAECKDKGSLR
jgi:hypothetical protein